jgi:H+/Cl- antiporter ClcA
VRSFRRPGFYRRSRFFLSRRTWRPRLAFWCGGLTIGVTAVVMAIAADYVQAWYRDMLGYSPYLSLAITPMGLALAVALTRRYFPGSQGSGIPQAIAARQFSDWESRTRLLSLRLAAGKILLTLLGLLCGASAGREGPTVQVGASVMHTVGRVWSGKHQGLILAGSAAGVAAAFNTPLAGIVFAIEEMSRSFEQRTSGLVLTTVIIAGIASLALLGNYTYFGHTAAALHQFQDWAAVPLCGVAGGLLGGIFSKIVVVFGRGLPGRTGQAIKDHPVIFAALCGLLVAGIGILSGGITYGTGYTEARHLVEGEGLSQRFGILKFCATTLSTISGIPGGIFSPSLAVGAGLGANVARLLPGAPLGAVVLLGMVGYFAGVVQAPITAFVIVLELTAGHDMAVPLMLTALIGYGTTRLIGAEPIYHALAETFLPHGAHEDEAAAGMGAAAAPYDRQLPQ